MTNPPGDDEPSKIDELAPAEEPEPKDRKRRRSRWLVIGVPVAVVVVAAAIVGGVLLVNNSSSSSTSPSAALDYGRVQQTTVAQTQTLSGTIAYTATQTVTNRLSTTSSSSTSSTSSSGSQGTSTSGSGSSTSSSSSTAPGSGTLTTMAAVGSVIKVGGTFFTVDEQPVVAMYGTLPAYRDMQDGDTGTDITQLQQSLVDLGYNPGGVDGTFGAATVAAVEAWQTAESLTVDGIVHLGQVVFVAGPSRVIAQVATIGDTAPSGTQILSIGPESPVVTTSESSTQLG
jgi:hypothetical protein